MPLNARFENCPIWLKMKEKGWRHCEYTYKTGASQGKRYKKLVRPPGTQISSKAINASFEAVAREFARTEGIEIQDSDLCSPSIVKAEAAPRKRNRGTSHPSQDSPAPMPGQVPVAFCKSELLVLGLQHANTMNEVRKIYMNLARVHHPDKGGDAEEFRKIHAAYERIVQLFADKDQGKLEAIITPEAWCWRMLESPHVFWETHLANVSEESREGMIKWLEDRPVGLKDEDKLFYKDPLGPLAGKGGNVYKDTKGKYRWLQFQRLRLMCRSVVKSSTDEALQDLTDLTANFAIAKAKMEQECEAGTGDGRNMTDAAGQCVNSGMLLKFSFRLDLCGEKGITTPFTGNLLNALKLKRKMEKQTSIQKVHKVLSVFKETHKAAREYCKDPQHVLRLLAAVKKAHYKAIENRRPADVRAVDECT